MLMLMYYFYNLGVIFIFCQKSMSNAFFYTIDYQHEFLILKQSMKNSRVTLSCMLRSSFKFAQSKGVKAQLRSSIIKTSIVSSKQMYYFSIYSIQETENLRGRVLSLLYCLSLLLSLLFLSLSILFLSQNLIGEGFNYFSSCYRLTDFYESFLLFLNLLELI